MRLVAQAVPQSLERRSSERLAITLPAFIRVVDRDYTAQLLNIDRSGAMVETHAPLAVNSKLQVRCGTVVADANVIWTEHNCAGVRFTTRLSDAQIAEHLLRSTAVKARRGSAQTAETQVQRKSVRISIEAMVKLRRRGHHNFTVQVFDLSPGGCRLEFLESPNLHESVWVKFPDLELLQANVRWAEGKVIGVQFARPIHPAVFDLLVERLQ